MSCVGGVEDPFEIIITASIIRVHKSLCVQKWHFTLDSTIYKHGTPYQTLDDFMLLTLLVLYGVWLWSLAFTSDHNDCCHG